MLAGSDSCHEELLGDFGSNKILRSAILYGANGSGKSNFLSALSFMKNLVTDSIAHQPGSFVFQAPHKLSAPDEPSEYKIQFVKNEVRYVYYFSVRNNLIYQEYLYYFPNGRPVKIFERNGLEVTAGDKFKNAFELSLNALKENRLFLSCAANFSKRKEIEEAFLFFVNDLVFYDPKINNWQEYSIQLMQDHEDMRKLFVQILRNLGTEAVDVKAKIEKVKITDLPQELQIPDFVKNSFGQQEANKIEAKIVYGKFEVDLSEESAGVQRLFEIICPIIDILKQGKVLIFDELETSLHEAVLYQIIDAFQKSKKEAFAQLIFSTHDTSLLDKNLFRRDQVWFTQLTKERATDLYSLAEIRNVRKSENLEKGYITGKYGAIPMLNEKFFQELEGI
jgi:hypothetical protein